MKKTAKSLLYYPLSLNVQGRKCVVIGGGQVALRKLKTLLEYGADVEVISSKLCLELIELGNKGHMRIAYRDYVSGDLQTAFIAIAATNDSAVNQQIVKEARDKGILVNVPDDPASSDFIVPSHLRRGDMTISVSTAGRSPALARNIRARLEEEYSDIYADLVNLVSEIRTEAQEQKIIISSAKWQKALDIDLMVDLLKKGNTEKAKATLRATLNIQKSNSGDTE